MALPRADRRTRVAGAQRAEGSRALARFRHLSVTIGVVDAAGIVAALLALRFIAAAWAGVRPGMPLVLLLAALEWIAVFHAFGLYRIERLSAWDEFRGIIAATTVGVGLIMVTTFWWNTSIPRSTLAWTWLFAISFELVARRLFRFRIRRLKRDGTQTMRTLLVGSNDEAARLAQVLEPPARGFAPVGYVAWSDRDDDRIARLGSIDDLEDVIRDERIDCVFVASSAVSPADLVTISRACRLSNVEMRVSANLPDILTSRVSIQPIDEVMALYLRPVRLTGTQAAVKRGFDLVAGIVALIVSLPMMLLIALAIGLTSRGPIVFRQRRMTKDDRVFSMLKFRTMVDDADRAGPSKLVDLTEPFFKLRDDPRLTPIGRVLRRFSLDELPQLWNVVRGEMSLVGPRPLRVEQIEADPAVLQPRHEVKAGMTGWWQVNGRSDVGFEDAVRMDLFYIDNWSLTLDLYILLKTAGAILLRKGAY